MIFNPVVIFSPLLTLNYFSCIIVHLKMREINDNWAITLWITSVNLEITAETSENTNLMQTRKD